MGLFALGGLKRRLMVVGGHGCTAARVWVVGWLL